MFKFSRLLNFLEDPRYPSVGPHLWLLRFTGIWHPDNSTKTRAKRALFYLIVAFFCSQYLKCLLEFDINGLKLVLQYAPFHMGIVKACFFEKDYEIWRKLIHYMSNIEQNQIEVKDKGNKMILKEYIMRNRKVTYFFWALALFSNFSIFSEPYQKNQVNNNGTSQYFYIFDGYTSFEREPPGYYVSMLIQTVLGNVVTMYVVGWDMLVVSIMIYFAGQLKISKLYCSRIIVDGSAEESRRNIAKLHESYCNLIKYQKMFSTLISPVMFIYLFVIAVNLGVCIIQIAEIEDDLPSLVSGCLFVLACLIQLLLFYWHSNEVTVESTFVSYSVFQSNWMGCDIKLQKEVYLLGLLTSKRLTFRAGPFNEMSLTTFVAVSKRTYSCSHSHTFND
uniref:Odorant receptor n=1 Tax=Dendrolimus punctatus TaxID=238572 RepID=A0A2K8GL59_9NEOP|nr:Odorant Receptor 39-2 [Dendrolimus punctatus]